MSDFRPPADIRQRLGYYLVGLAIGFAMLGVLWSVKSRMAAARGTPAPAQAAP